MTSYTINIRSLFLDNETLVKEIIDCVATDLLGAEQKPLLAARYRDMKENFDNVTEWFAASKFAKRYPEPLNLWRFSDGVTPFAEKGREPGTFYTDTTSVTMPITHFDFRFLAQMAKDTTQTCRGAIGLDLPTWFGSEMPKRVMIVAQDPLRNPHWYGNKDRDDDTYVCSDAVISSPFGLHSFEHRERGGGGKRMWLLVQNLLNRGIGVYLTDCRKYFYYSHEESGKLMKNEGMNLREKYDEILAKEIKIFKPNLIVPLGRDANVYIQGIKSLDVPVISGLPHFSGAAGGAISKCFPGCKDIQSQALAYADKISKALESVKL